MLVLSTLNGLLAQLVSSRNPHTAILLTPQGHLVAFHSSDKGSGEDRIRILAGLGSEVWRDGLLDDDVGSESDEESDDDDDEQVGMLECELGRILVVPIFASPSKSSPPAAFPKGAAPLVNVTSARQKPALLLALNGTDDSPWGLMHVKARTLATYLREPLSSVGDRLAPGSSPVVTRNGTRMVGR